MINIKSIASVLLLMVFFIRCSTNKQTTSVDVASAVPAVRTEQIYKVLLEEDVVYASGLSHESVNSEAAKTLPLKLDLHLPDNDSENRPVFVFVHGGGFSGGSKQQGRIREWANYYASRGWVFISIDYRLKRHKGTVPQPWLEHATKVPQKKVAQYLAIYPAQRDAKAALRWVHANAEKYKINTNYLTVGGGSAGAITAITAGIAEAEDFRDELSVQQDPTLSGTHLEQEFEVKTIVNLWGSKVALDALETIYGHQRFGSNNPPMFVAHGTEDPTVPFSSAVALKELYDSNNVPIAYYPLEGKGHGAWGATVNNKSLEKLAFDFMVEQQGLVVK